MKYLLILMIVAGVLAGCSKQEEKSEQVGADMADQIKAPIDKARAVYEKARETREVELPQ